VGVDGPAVELCPTSTVLSRGYDTPRVGAPGLQRRPGGSSGVAGDPSTSRSGAGTDVR
jgi:hypothetical protein